MTDLYLFNFATTADFECYTDDSGDCDDARDLAGIRASVAPSIEAAQLIARNDVILSMGAEDPELDVAGNWELDEQVGEDTTYTLSDRGGNIICYLNVRKIA